MKCDIPGCDNESVKTVTKNSIYFGLAKESLLNICECHNKKEIESHLQTAGEEESKNTQLVNPFLICNSLNRSCI